MPYGYYPSVYGYGEKTSNAFAHNAAMKDTGWTCKRNGHLRRYYEAGVLVAAYSYDACIYTRIEDQEMDLRHVLNLTTYSKTTTDHQNTILQELCGTWFARGMWTDSWRCAAPLPEVFRTAIDFFALPRNITHRQLVYMANARLQGVAA